MLHVAQLESATETKARLPKDLNDAREKLKSLDKDGSAKDKALAKEAVEKLEKRLKEIEEGIDTIIDDGFDTCYESVAKIAATKTKAGDIWDAFKGGIANNLKDVMMSIDTEELFTISENNGELEDKINKRKIKEIEQILTDKVKDSKLNDGVKLIVLDVAQIRWRPKLKNGFKRPTPGLRNRKPKVRLL